MVMLKWLKGVVFIEWIGGGMVNIMDGFLLLELIEMILHIKIVWFIMLENNV